MDYATPQDLADYAGLRGSVIEPEAATTSALLVRAMDYIDAAYSFVGDAVDDFRQWPRQNTGYPTVDGVVPPIIKSATCQVALDLFNGVGLEAGALEPVVVEESVKVDGIETKYALNQSRTVGDAVHHRVRTWLARANLLQGAVYTVGDRG